MSIKHELELSIRNLWNRLTGLKRGTNAHAGILLWIWPFRFNLERWGYTLQRITGIGAAFYFLAHIVETGNVVGGASVWSIPNYSTASSVWTATARFLRNPFFDIGLALIGFAVFYHTINGIRLTLTEFGLLVGKPRRPDFPYVAESLNNAQKAIFWLSIAIAGVATFYALKVLFG